MQIEFWSHYVKYCANQNDMLLNWTALLSSDLGVFCLISSSCLIEFNHVFANFLVFFILFAVQRNKMQICEISFILQICIKPYQKNITSGYQIIKTKYFIQVYSRLAKIMNQIAKLHTYLYVLTVVTQVNLWLTLRKS